MDLKLVMVLLATLLVTTVSAETTLTSLEFTWDGEPITTISPSFPLTAFLEFSLDGENIESITVDASQINDKASYQEQYASLTVDPNTCVSGSSGLLCNIPNLIIETGNPNPVITVTINETLQLTHTHSFIIDETQPEVIFLGTDFCEEECYLPSARNTQITIDMQDSIGSFNRKRVAISLAGPAIPVIGCEGLSCWTNAQKECADGALVRLSVVTYNGWPSSDDAGNPLTGILETDLICDATNPEVLGVTYESLSGLPSSSDDEELPFGHLGDSMIVSMQVLDNTPQLSITANLDEVSANDTAEGSCTEALNHTTTNPLWDCSITLPLTPEEPEEITFPITISDFVENKVVYDATILVLAVDADIDPDDWTVTDPDTILANKHYLEYSTKKLFMEVSLTPDVESYELLDALAGSCTPLLDRDNESIGTDGDIQELEIISFSKESVLFTAYLRQGNQYDEFDQTEYNCTVDILTKRGNTLNTMYEKEFFILTIDFHGTETQGEQVAAKIQEIVDKYEEESDVLLSQKQKVNFVAGLCNIPAVFKGVGGGLSSVGGALMASSIPGVTDVGSELHGVGKSFNEGGEAGYFTETCSILTCTHPGINDFIPSAIDNVLDNSVLQIPGASSIDGAVDKITGTETYSETLNPWNSQMAAYMKACYPAILYHRERDLAIQCEYAACLSQEVQNGFSDAIDSCGAVRNYAECRYTYGGIFNVIPFANILKQTHQVLVETISNPVSFFTTAGSVLACKVFQNPDPTGSIGTGDIADALCHAKVGIEGGIQAWNQFEQIRLQLDNMLASESSLDACSTLLTSIDPDTTYWNYLDDVDRSAFKEEQEVAFGGFTYPVACNEFTGCTSTIGKGTNARTFTVIPTSDATQLIFVDGKRVNDFSPTTIKELDLPSTFVDAEGRLTENFKNLIGQDPSEENDLVDTARNFRANLAANYENEEFYERYNNYLFTYGALQNDLDLINRDLRLERDDYISLTNLESNMRHLGQTNDDFDLLMDRVEDLYLQSWSPEEREIFSTAMTGSPDGFRVGMSVSDTNLRDPAIYDQTLISGVADVNGEEFLSLFDGTSLASDLRSTAESREDLLGNVGEGIDNGWDFVELGVSLDEVENHGTNLMDSKVDGIVDEIETAKTKQNDIVEELEVKQKEKEEEIKKEEDDLQLDKEYWENYATGWQAWRSTLRFARTINTVGPQISNFIGTLFGKENLYEAWKGFLDEKLLGNLPGDPGWWTADYEGAFCRSNLSPEAGEMLVTKTAANTFVSTVRVEGLRLREGFEEANYTYIINAYVNNYDQEGALSFEVILRNGAGSGREPESFIPNTETIVLERTDVEQGDPLIRTKSNPLEVNTNKYYEEVCINFFTSNLDDFFENTDVESEFCRGLEDG